MKMYTFDAGGYNAQYTVMAESKDDALEYLKRNALLVDYNRLKWIMSMQTPDTKIAFPLTYKIGPKKKKEYNSLEEWCSEHGFTYKDYLSYIKPDFEIQVRDVGEVFTSEVS